MSRLLIAGWRNTRRLNDNRVIMARQPHPESQEAIAWRLQITREALELSQAELCRRTGIGKAAWNNAETGDNRIGLDAALALARTFGIGLDWTYRGILRDIPSDLAKKIEARMSAAGAATRR
jgi:transcriptional regulator with XRE-family HTH domain